MFKNCRPFVPLQHESAECGLVCIRAAAAVLGFAVDVELLKEQGFISQRGMRFSDLLAVCEQVGLGATPVALSRVGAGHIRRNTVVLQDGRHFVLIGRTRRTRVDVFDPAIGWRWLSLAHLKSRMGPIAVEITRLPNSVEMQRTDGPWPIIEWLRNSKIRAKDLIIPSAIGSLSIGLMVAIPLLTKVVVDGAAPGSQNTGAIAGVVSVLLAGILAAATTFVAERVAARTSLLFSRALTGDLTTRLFSLPLSFFSRQTSISLASRIRVVDDLRSGLVSLGSDLFGKILLGILALAITSWISPLFAASSCFAAGMATAHRMFQQRSLRDRVASCAHAEIQYQSILTDAIDGAQAIKLAGAQVPIVERIALAHRSATNERLLLEDVRASHTISLAVASSAYSAAILFLTTRLMANGTISFGDFVAATAYSGMIGMAFAALTEVAEFRSTLVYAEGRLEPLIRRQILEHANRPVSNHSSRTDLALTIENLTFAYSAFDAPVLRTFSLDIEAGEFVAVVGGSGAGKSTLAKLMVGALSPSSGEIRVFGDDLRECAVAERRLISAVMQDDRIINGSIFENIDFYRGLGEAAIVRAARLAQIHETVVELPMKYETLISEGVKGLSGGQRQRILLARALASAPRIIVLDEATSALDHHTESLVMDALAAMSTTRVVFTHRRETLRLAHRVITIGPVSSVLVDEVRESGTGDLPASGNAGMHESCALSA